MKKRYLIALFTLFIFSVFFTSGCRKTNSKDTPSQSATENPYQNISSEQLKKMIESEKNLMVIDVREKNEYNTGHIKSAILLPTSEIRSRVNEIPKDKKFVLVCASGARSSQVAAWLVQMGYKEVYNLEGGLSSWPYELDK